jgi:histidinol-phosphate aminotransferase
MLEPRKAVRSLKSYHPPLGNPQGLRLDFNENTVGCSPRVMQKLRELDVEQLARYPEREPLEATVASHLGILPEELLLTNGTDEAIHLVCETYLEPSDQAIVVVPTFSMYEIYVAATGAKVVAVPAAEDFRFPLENVHAHINELTRLVAIANPNNPTGALASRKDLLTIAERAPNAALLIDEAYFEFCGETLLPEFRRFPNLFVSRTFSKAYGLAGLRIGVLAAHPDQMRFLRPVSSPYNVNSIALACLPDALADQTYVRQYVDEVRSARDRLERELQEWGVRYWPSHANFVLMYFGPQAPAFISAMRERGILVRDRSNDQGCAGCVRITLGSEKQTNQMLMAFREAFEQIGIGQKVSG